MNLFDFFFRQRVTQSQLDWVFEQAQDAIHALSTDNNLLGIVGGLDAIEHAPVPDKTIDVDGPGIAYDPEGQRCYVSDLLSSVDCSKDEFGTDSNPAAGEERYISVFLRSKREYTEPALDGNNVTVYTKQLESYEFFVRLGTSAPVGFATPAPLMGDAVLLADMLVADGFTAILNSDFDYSRRQDWLRYDGVITGEIHFGNAHDAIDRVLDMLNALADTIISATDYTGTYVSWSSTSVAGALDALAGAVDGHIGGAAPQHPDTSITAAAIAGTPESFAGGQAHQALVALYGHINERTERATAEIVSGAWSFKNPLLTTSRASEINNLKFKDNPFFKTLHGGSSSHYATPGSIAAQLCHNNDSWACPWAWPNSVSLGGTLALRDIAMTFNPADGTREIVVADNTNFSLYHFKAIGPTIASSISLATFFPAGTYSIDAICSDERYIYVLVKNTGTTAHYINAIDLTGVVRTGWAATGTALPGVGSSPFSPTIALTGNVRVATMDSNNQYAVKLATLNNWQKGGSGLMVSIIDAVSGAILANGDGDIASIPVPPIVLANVCPRGGLCSDGVNIYFTWSENGGTGSAGVATAQIANPLLGSGYANMPMTDPAGTSVYSCLLFDGDGIWAFEWGGDIWIYRWQDKAWDRKTGGGTGDYKFACFDGLNMWMQAREAGAGSMEIYKLPSAQNRALGSGSQTVLNMMRLGVGFMRLGEAGSTLAAYMGRMCFDGDAIWMVMHTGAGNPMSGIVRSLPGAAMR